MSAADAILAAPSREPTRHSLTTRIVIYGLLILFAAVYLVPLIVMVMTSLKPLDEVTGGNMFALPHTLTFDPWVKAWGEARIGVSDTAWYQGLLLELDQNGRAGGADLDFARRAERLCSDEVAISRP